MAEQSGVLGPESILVIEDDLAFARLLVTFLKKQGYDAETVPTAAEMFQKLEDKTYDCLIVDLTLPDEDGIVLVRKLRARAIGPLIVLTGRDGIDDKLASFEVGADDFIAKPFNPRELVARIRAILRRSGQGRGKVEPDTPVSTPQTARAGYHFAGWCFDMNTHQLLSETKDEVIELSANEVALLSIFLKNPQRVLSRDRLLDATKHRDATPFDRSIDMQISRLRQKIEENPKKPKLIKTIRGGGYTFTLSADQIVKTGT